MKKAVSFLTIFSFLSIVGSAYAQDSYNADDSSPPPQNGQMQAPQTTDQTAQPTATMNETPDEVNLKMAMRKLWEDHIEFTRNYIISALANLPDADAVSKRLLQNQDDIGNAIKPYYGDEAGNKLAQLLRDHIVIATQVVKAAKAHDKKNLEASQQKWNANADQIAAFLSNANSNWSKEDLQTMLHQHLDLTTGEVTSRLKKDWNADIDYFDKGQDHMLKFADALSDGIIKQFPKKFNTA